LVSCVWHSLSSAEVNNSPPVYIRECLFKFPTCIQTSSQCTLHAFISFDKCLQPELHLAACHPSLDFAAVEQSIVNDPISLHILWFQVMPLKRQSLWLWSWTFDLTDVQLLIQTAVADKVINTKCGITPSPVLIWPTKPSVKNSMLTTNPTVLVDPGTKDVMFIIFTASMNALTCSSVAPMYQKSFSLSGWMELVTIA
jgi:hypothetical protein